MQQSYICRFSGPWVALSLYFAYMHAQGLPWGYAIALFLGALIWFIFFCYFLDVVSNSKKYTLLWTGIASSLGTLTFWKPLPMICSFGFMRRPYKIPHVTSCSYHRENSLPKPAKWVKLAKYCGGTAAEKMGKIEKIEDQVVNTNMTARGLAGAASRSSAAASEGDIRLASDIRKRQIMVGRQRVKQLRNQRHEAVRTVAEKSQHSMASSCWTDIDTERNSSGTGRSEIRFGWKAEARGCAQECRATLWRG